MATLRTVKTNAPTTAVRSSPTSRQSPRWVESVNQLYLDDTAKDRRKRHASVICQRAVPRDPSAHLAHLSGTDRRDPARDRGASKRHRSDDWGHREPLLGPLRVIAPAERKRLASSRSKTRARQELRLARRSFGVLGLELRSSAGKTRVATSSATALRVTTPTMYALRGVDIEPRAFRRLPRLYPATLAQGNRGERTRNLEATLHQPTAIIATLATARITRVNLSLHCVDACQPLTAKSGATLDPPSRSPCPEEHENRPDFGSVGCTTRSASP